jgi:D-glycero-alpha-D-manno-heptose-7-phosphate kinase
MAYHLSVPARINILGNPGDAVEGDFATISAAINQYAEARIEGHEHILLEILQPDGGEFHSTDKLLLTPEQIPIPYEGEQNLIKGAINLLYKYSAEFRNKLENKGFHFTTWTYVPRQSGLGGSSLFVLLTLAGLRAHYDLDPQIHNDYVLAELTQRVEAKELGITAGYADRYVPLFGGIAYLDYRGKLYQKQLDDEPYATYERLDPWVDEFPLVAISSGVKHDSGDVHGRMRPRYLEEHEIWQIEGGTTPPMVRFMQAAWETAWKGKIALIQKDWATFGSLMNRNHHLVDEMMTYCGFEDGAGWANNLLIDTALKNGALGAKLTGAGGGGSVFALTQPGEENNLAEVWQRAADEAGLTNAQIIRPQISRRGLIITKD